MKVLQALLISRLLPPTFPGLASLTGLQTIKSSAPRVYLIEGKSLPENKRRLQSGDKTFAAVLAKLETDAKRAMQQNPMSVITKDVRPPSSDKHDVESISFQGNDCVTRSFAAKTNSFNSNLLQETFRRPIL